MAYDYVLAGGGSAGATLAARLSEDHKITVCLIEAGGSDAHPFISTPDVCQALFIKDEKNWADYVRIAKIEPQ